MLLTSPGKTGRASPPSGRGCGGAGPPGVTGGRALGFCAVPAQTLYLDARIKSPLHPEAGAPTGSTLPMKKPRHRGLRSLLGGA